MIYFASDIHLGSGDRATQRDVEQRFVQWLDKIEPTAQVLFLVGDIFDFWFEYKRVVPLPINGDLYFDNNESGVLFLMQECYPALKDVVQALTQYPQINVNIIGRIMTEGLNVKKDNEVSKARAEAIKKYLVSQGIAESRITTRGSSIKELEAQIKEQSRSRNKTLNPPCEIRIANKK